MKFGSAGTDDEMSDWTNRVTPFLPSDHPHQACCQESRETGQRVCHCPPRPCQESCCAPSDEEAF